jgi:hypothetical protein
MTTAKTHWDSDGMIVRADGAGRVLVLPDDRANLNHNRPRESPWPWPYRGQGHGLSMAGITRVGS